MSTYHENEEGSLSSRFAAGSIDAAIVAILGGGGAHVVAAAFAATGFAEAVTEPIRKLTLLLVFTAYVILFTSGSRQATWGQWLFGLRVLGANGGRMTHAEALVRWLALLAAILPLGAGLLIGLGRERRPFQDRLCESRVVRRKLHNAGESA